MNIQDSLFFRRSARIPFLAFDDDATLWSSDLYGRVVVTANACPDYLLNAGRVRGLV